MKFQLSTSNLIKKNTDCIVIGVFEGRELTPSAEKVNALSKNAILALLKSGEFQGKPEQTLMLHQLPQVPPSRVLLVGCGKKEGLTERQYRKIITSSVNALKKTQASQVISCLTEIEVSHRDTAWKVKHIVEDTLDALYCFDRFKSKKEKPCPLSQITLTIPEKTLSASKKALEQGLAINSGVHFTKDLANMPSNICNPTYLAVEAKQLAKKYSAITVKVLEEKDMKKLGMGALLAVSQGSATPPKLICIEYKGTAKKQAPIALVGKGVTFDTGGLSMKSPDAMVGMKYDMCGAATVLGTLKAAAELKLPMHVVGIIPAVENMPSGVAIKPEDIVTSLSGQTIEILNTDAEGRLILCDALTYTERYKPQAVIDIATLTGAVVVALGFHVSAVLSNHQPLADELLAAGTESHDRVWQMPLWEEYQDQLKSPFADMANVGGKSAGTITASCFLSRFTKKFHWAHLDVAGTAAMMMGGSDRYATGRPVPLLMQYLINRCNDGK